MKFLDFCYFMWNINLSKSFDAWWYYRSTVAPTAVIFMIYYLLTFFNSIILDNRCLYIILCTVYTDTVSEFINCTIKLCHFLNIVNILSTKMHITSATYLHQNSANWAINMLLFFMLWCWCCSLNSSQIAQLESAVPALFSP